MRPSPDNHGPRPPVQQEHSAETTRQTSVPHARFGISQLQVQPAPYQLPADGLSDTDQPTSELPVNWHIATANRPVTTNPLPDNIPVTGHFPMKIPTTGNLPGNGPVTTGHLPATRGTLPGNGPVTTGHMPAQPRMQTQQYFNHPPVITGQLPGNEAWITRKLSTSGTTTRPLTLIPAAGKTQKLAPEPPPQRRRPILFIGALAGCLLILILTTVFVAPLDNAGTHGQTIAQTIGSFLTTGQANSFNPLEHVAPPTATPALLTTEGYCGGKDLWGTCATAVTDSGQMGSGQMQAPITGARVTQPFANPEFQTWCNCVKPHSGIDLAAPYNTPITAADSGQVIWVGWDWSGLGWAVKINHGHYIATVYGHMARYIVKVGDNVTKGQVIGYEGSTGASTGPHLHFMVVVNNKWVNPTLYVRLP